MNKFMSGVTLTLLIHFCIRSDLRYAWSCFYDSKWDLNSSGIKGNSKAAMAKKNFRKRKIISARA